MSDYEKAVTTRLKTARGHLDGVIRMVEQEAYCPDVMKQLAAVQGLVEATSRMVFRNHLETCGQGDAGGPHSRGRRRAHGDPEVRQARPSPRTDRRGHSTADDLTRSIGTVIQG